VGVNTLFTKGLAQSGESGKEYNPVILFKNVDYDGDEVNLRASDGRDYSFNRLSLENTDVLVRCQCKDFRYRFSFYNHLDNSLHGRKPKKYESKGVGPPANPSELPGLCKHLMKMSRVLEQAGIF
jgi:hypothetical protein